MKNTIKLFKTTFIASMLAINFIAKAEMIETHNVKEIKNEIAKLAPGDMALFDVKDVIFYPEDQVMTHMHKSFFKERFAEIEESKGKEEAARLMSIVLSSYSPLLVDIEIPKIIAHAQKSGVLVLGLTSGKTSQYGIIENRADKRVQTLRDFGIDFSKSINLPPIDLGRSDNAQQNNENGNSIFQDGIIFASRIPKGEILGRFLKASKLRPKKIVFVDNRLKNINFVGDKCAELGIEYVGIYFTKISKQPYKHLDDKIAEKKFEILLEKNIWIRDEDAKGLLRE